MDQTFRDLVRNNLKDPLPALLGATSSGTSERGRHAFKKWSCTYGEVRDWLGDQAWKMDGGPGSLFLLEVFCGRARLSEDIEKHKYTAIRIGTQYGHDLALPNQRRYLHCLIDFLKPEHVWVAWPCTFLGSWSRFNIARGEKTKQRILAGRRQAAVFLGLFRDIYQQQVDDNRHCHGENPRDSLAWQSPILTYLINSYDVKWATFDQCRTGLRCPATNLPHQKPTKIVTSSQFLSDLLDGRTCQCPEQWSRHHQTWVRHQPLQGQHKGKYLTKYAEEYPIELARIFAFGLRRNYQVSFAAHSDSSGQLTEDDKVFLDQLKNAEPQLWDHGGWTVHLQNLCYVVCETESLPQDQVPGLWTEVTVYFWAKNDDQQPQVLQRRAHPRELRHLVLPETAHRRLLVYSSTGAALPSSSPQLHTWIRRLHEGLGHASVQEMVQMLRTAGNVREDVLEAVRQFRCAICDALTPPGSHRVSSNHQPQHVNDIISLDFFFVTLTRDGKDPLKVAVLTVLDVATGFVALHLAGSPSSETVSAALGGGWFRFYGPPKDIYADADGAWTSASFEQFLNRYGVQLRTSAAEAPWQHGKTE